MAKTQLIQCIFHAPEIFMVLRRAWKDHGSKMSATQNIEHVCRLRT